MPALRGTSIFSPAELDHLVSAVVVPETDAEHNFALVAATSASGIDAALIYARPMGSAEWRLEAAWKYDWGGGITAGAKVVVRF